MHGQEIHRRHHQLHGDGNRKLMFAIGGGISYDYTCDVNGNYIYSQNERKECMCFMSHKHIQAYIWQSNFLKMDLIIKNI